MSRPVIRDFAAVVVSALLLALPYHFSFLWPLSFFAFIPYFFSLENKSRGRVVFQSLVLGILFFAITMYWLNYVNIFAFILLVIYLSLYFALFGFYSAQFFSKKSRGLEAGPVRAALTMAALWVLLEWVRGWLFSGLPWALLGYSQWKNVLFIQVADVAGVWGVSFLLLFLNVLFYQFLSYKKIALGCLYAAAAVLAVVYLYGFLKMKEWEPRDLKPSLRVSVLQGNIPQDQKWDAKVRGIIFEKYKRLTLMSANEASDLIVWPETSFPGFFEDEPVMAAHLRSTIRRANTPTLVGVPTLGGLEEGLRSYNSTILFSPSGEESQRYSKTHLVPFGEFLPFEPLLGFIRHLVVIGRFSPGQEKSIFVLKPRAPQNYLTARFGVLICYEDMFPSLVRDFVKKGADFLVNVTNDAWFGNTAAPYQHAQASVFRAVENRVPVIRSANTGFSCFISASGEVVGSVNDRGKEIMVTGHQTQGIFLRKSTSLYRLLGDWFLLVCAALLWFSWRQANKPNRYSRL